MGATIEAVQTESGLRRVVTSGSDGGYSFPNLPVGPYQMTVSQSGFDTYTQTGIIVQVGNNLRIDIKLTVGGITQTIQVDAAASMVQTEDQSVSQVIDPKRIIDMPLNGRQATDLILLTGAALTAPAGDLVGSKNYPSSVSISIAGSQGTNTNYLMDGADNNDAFSNVNLPFPFPDAVQEFSVQTSGLSAQYGLHPGAIVNIVTKSGTNNFHGTFFDFFRNGDLNSKSYFSTTQDSLKRNQFGGTVGGPIKKDKLSFFGAYQGTRTRQQANNITTYIPTPAILNNDWTAYAAGSCQSTGKAKPLSSNYFYTDANGVLRSSVPLSNAAKNFSTYLPTTSASACGKYVYGPPQPQNEDQYLGRSDWNINEKQTFFGRYFLTHYTQPGFFGGNLLMAANPALNDQAQSLDFGHTWTINSSLVNSIHVNGTRNFISRNGDSKIPTPASIGVQNFSSPVPNYIYVSVTGDFSAACGTCELFDVTTNAENLVEDLFWTKGKHHLSFGANYIHNHLNVQGTNNVNGQFTFSGATTGDALADFMLGETLSLYQGNNTGSTYRKNTIGMYGQDSYQMSTKLTLNAGVRWESDLPEIENAGRGVSFSRAAFNAGQTSSVYKSAPAGLLFVGDSGIPSGYIQNHWDHFEPRVGFAYDPTGKGNSSIRGSYTLGFQTPLLYLEGRFENNAPFGDAVTIYNVPFDNPYATYSGGNPFPQPFPPSHTSAFFPQQGTYFVYPTNLKPTYTQTWNLSVQQQFAKDWEVTAAYLGNHTLHVWAGNEQNPATYIPGTWTGPGSCGPLTVAPGPVGTKCSINSGATANTNYRRALALQNPAQYGNFYGQVSEEYDGAAAKFNGGLLTVQHRFAHYYTLLANYTLSHCLAGAIDAGDLAGNSFQNPENPNADYGNCGMDLRQNFVTSLVIRSEVKGGTPLRKQLLDGWQVAPIVTMTTGTPFTILSGADNSYSGVYNSSASSLDRPNQVGDPYMHGAARKYWMTSSGFLANATGTYGTTRPYAYFGPDYYNMNSALTKFVPLPETMQLEVRGECFNCLNHPNLSTPNATLNSSTFGQITSVVGQSNNQGPRIIQISMKVDF